MSNAIKAEGAAVTDKSVYPDDQEQAKPAFTRTVEVFREAARYLCGGGGDYHSLDKIQNDQSIGSRNLKRSSKGSDRPRFIAYKNVDGQNYKALSGEKDGFEWYQVPDHAPKPAEKSNEEKSKTGGTRRVTADPTIKASDSKKHSKEYLHIASVGDPEEEMAWDLMDSIVTIERSMILGGKESFV